MSEQMFQSFDHLRERGRRLQSRYDNAMHGTLKTLYTQLAKNEHLVLDLRRAIKDEEQRLQALDAPDPHGDTR